MPIKLCRDKLNYIQNRNISGCRKEFNFFYNFSAINIKFLFREKNSLQLLQLTFRNSFIFKISAATIGNSIEL